MTLGREGEQASKQCWLMNSSWGTGLDRGKLHQGENEKRPIHCHFPEEQHGKRSTRDSCQCRISSNTDMSK